jgi:hypothetical protein
MRIEEKMEVVRLKLRLIAAGCRGRENPGL